MVPHLAGPATLISTARRVKISIRDGAVEEVLLLLPRSSGWFSGHWNHFPPSK